MMPPTVTNEQTDSTHAINFVEKLNDLVKNLTYPSESDQPIRVIDWQADNPAPFDVLLLKKYLGLTPADAIHQKKWEDFFEPMITIKDWYGEEERQRAQKFQELKDTMAQNLQQMQYFQTGRVETEAYLIGKDTDGKWKGLKTLIVHS